MAPRGASEKSQERKAKAYDAVEASPSNGRAPRNSPHSVATPARNSGGRGDRRGGEAKGDRHGGSRGQGGAIDEALRKKGVDEAWTVLEDMQQKGQTTDKFTVSRLLMKTVGYGNARSNASRLYRCMGLVEKFIDSQPKDVDEVLFNALLDTCCRLKDLNRLESIVTRMRELKVVPSPVTLGILVKTYGQAGDLEKVLKAWTDMEKQRIQANAVTYGCMIDACVKCGNLDKAVEIFRDMKVDGKHKNTILYTTMIKGYGLNKDLKNALTLFREMAVEGVPYNTITFNSMIDACIKCGDLAQGELLLQEMMAPESGLEPDLITFSTLLKGYCLAGDLNSALYMASTIKERGLRCDELVYNTLMDGCVKANDAAAGIGLFEEMVAEGMKPSPITHGILSRLYQRTYSDVDAANEAVAELYRTHGIPAVDRKASDRSRGGPGRKWNTSGQRSPGGASDRTLEPHTPVGSPMAMSPGGYSDACWLGGGSAWGDLPALPSFDCMSMSEPCTPTPGNTPCSQQASASGMAGEQPLLSPAPPLPSMGAASSSPNPSPDGFQVGAMWPMNSGLSPCGQPFPGPLPGSPGTAPSMQQAQQMQQLQQLQQMQQMHQMQQQMQQMQMQMQQQQQQQQQQMQSPQQLQSAQQMQPPQHMQPVPQMPQQMQPQQMQPQMQPQQMQAQLQSPMHAQMHMQTQPQLPNLPAQMLLPPFPMSPGFDATWCQSQTPTHMQPSPAEATSPGVSPGSSPKASAAGLNAFGFGPGPSAGTYSAMPQMPLTDENHSVASEAASRGNVYPEAYFEAWAGAGHV